MSVEFTHIIDYLLHQKYPDKSSASFKRTLRKRVENFLVKDGDQLFYCLGWKKMSEEQQASAKLREVVLDDGRKRKLILALHHGKGDGQHMGHQKIVKKLTEDYYWMGMHVDARRIIKTCHVCRLKQECVTCPDISLDEPEEDGAESIADEESTISDSVHDFSQYDDGAIEDLFPSSSAFQDYGSQARHFWDKVEVDVIGPYPSSPDAEKGYFVVLFVDSFSSWPEAFVMESFNTSSITMALFSLISRYGVMSSVACMDQALCDDLSETLRIFSENDCPVMVENKLSRHAAELWKQLKHGVEDFVVSLPTEWFKYLEFCLLPFRVSRPEHADYSPVYLAMGRELRLPANISHQDSNNRRVERHFTKEQVCTSLTNFKEMFYHCVAFCQERETHGGDFKDIKIKVERDEKDLICNPEDDADYDPADDGGIDDSDEERDRSMMKGSTESSTPEKGSVKRKRGGAHTNNYGNMYLALKDHLLGKGYPPGYTTSMKRSLRKILPTFFLKEDTLYHVLKNEPAKEVVMDEKDRLKILHKSHVSETGKHFTAAETYGKFTDMYYWKGISLDTQEFVRACPHCEEGKPRPGRTVKKDACSPTKTNVLGACLDEQKLLGVFEDSTELYRPLVSFLKTKEMPPNLEEKEMKLLKVKAANHSLKADGSLYLRDRAYADKTGEALMRMIVFTPAEKIEVIKSCHIIPETGKHHGKAQTHTNMSQLYYWPRISQDVAKFIQNCNVCTRIQESICQPRAKKETTSAPSTPKSCAASPTATSTPNVSSGTKMRTRSGSRAPAVSDSLEPGSELPMETSSILSPETATLLPLDETKISRQWEYRLTRRKRFERFFCGEGGNVDDVAGDHGYSISSPAATETEAQDETAEMAEGTVTQDSCEKGADKIISMEQEEAIEGHVETVITERTERVITEHIRRTTDTPNLAQQAQDLSPIDQSSLDPLSTAVEMVLNGEANASPASTPMTRGKGGKGKHICNICGSVLSGYIKYQIHMSSHTGEKPFTCETCGAKVRSTKSLRQHQLRHQGELDRRTFLCDMCGKEFRSKYMLINHKQGQHFNKFTCPSCNKAFSSKAAFAKHDLIQCGVNPLQCKICKWVCRRKSELRNHVLKHAGISTKGKLRHTGDDTEDVLIETNDHVMQEITQAAANVEIPQAVESVVEMQAMVEAPEYITHNVIITESPEVIEGENASVITSMTDFDSLLGLAEQVVQAQFGDMHGQDVQYQIVYPDNTSQIVILQHEATHRAVQP